MSYKNINIPSLIVRVCPYYRVIAHFNIEPAHNLTHQPGQAHARSDPGFAHSTNLVLYTVNKGGTQIFHCVCITAQSAAR